MKITCFSIKPVKVFLSLMLVCLTLLVMVPITKSQSVFFGYTDRKVPIYSVKTDQKKVALTFDAAWGADKTSKIVEILKNEGVGGTFFLVGFWSEKYPDKIKEIDAAGLDIGTHSNTHPKMSQLSKQQVESELETSKNLITKVTGKPVRFFRPPYGDYNNQLIETADSMGLQTIQWSVDSLDWRGLTSEQIMTRIRSGLHKGAIILFHNNSDYIVDVLPMVIRYLKSEGYSMVNLSELVYESGYTIDNTGLQKKLTK